MRDEQTNANSVTVIEEEEYLQNLSSIIQRDFFPSLRSLKLQNEFLDAVAAGDAAKSKVIAAAIRSLNPTPDNDGNRGTAEDALSLDQYQGKFTSEDNHSFNQLLKAENEERVKKYAWFFGKDSKGKGKLLLEGTPGNDSKLLVADETEQRQMALIEGPKHDMKAVNTWNYKTKNSLMYYPETPQADTAVISNPRLAKLPPKAINHSATSFDETDAIDTLIKATPALNPRLETQEVWRDIAAATPALFSTSERNNGSFTPQVGGQFGYIPSTPSLEPHTDVDPEEMFTWGTIAGTPLLVDQGSSSERSFRIPDTPRREVLAEKLASKARKSLAQKAQSKSDLGVFKRPVERIKTPLVGGGGSLRMMSPAAQKLYSGGSTSAKGLFAKARTPSNVDMQLRASYSPSLSSRTNTPSARKPLSTPSLPTGTREPATPNGVKDIARGDSKGDMGNARRPGEDARLTDNLLDF